MKRLVFTIAVLSISLTSALAVVQTAPAVGAPLDGGLLALLAGAGIAYITARKKKLNKEQ